MRSALVAFACGAACACVVGPSLVRAPMLASVPAVKAPDDAGDEGAAPDDSADQASAAMAGTWTAHGPSGGKFDGVEVTLEARGDNVVGRARYPGRHCSVEWTLHRTRSRRWDGAEVVRVNPFNLCPSHGRVSLEWLDSGSLRWSWRGPGDDTTAVLDRSQP